jgi:hypothetical protein
MIMKQRKFLLLVCGFFIGWSIQSFGQETTLPPVTVVSLNYKYLKSVLDPNNAQPVRMLEQKAASYDIKNSEYYEEDEYDGYFISFYLPQGQILATYDADGKLLRTAERFTNMALPAAVRTAITNRYPNWVLAKDVYLVDYNAGTPNSKKVYKVKLENGTKRLRVKTDETGHFIERT